MEYAIQLLIPVIGGLMLGMWLTNTYHASPIWTVVLAILGMVAGIGIMYRRFSVPQDGVASMKMPFPPQKKINSAKTGQPEPHRPEPHRKDVKDLDFLYHKYEDDSDDWKELDELDDQVSFDEPPPYGASSPSKQKNPPPQEDDDES
jgi:hypothetical protein